ncbi:MUC2 protein, partial [Rhinopomastus cyanomelas]|nr:MUC2 protein [Rhinopomastus cyanomelas]
CIWTDWIDVSYPNYSDKNGGDNETFDNILEKDPSWECARVENISCRAEKFPDTPIEDLGQKVECSVDKGLLCKNSDQLIGGIIPMPVCLNYEISVCCTPNTPECLSPITTTTSTAPPSTTTSRVSRPPTTTRPSSTTSSTLTTTTSVPVTSTRPTSTEGPSTTTSTTQETTTTHPV